MRPFFVILFLGSVMASGNAEDVFSGSWYRNDPGQGAILQFQKINDKILVKLMTLISRLPLAICLSRLRVT